MIENDTGCKIINDVATIILAGGRSSRMLIPKVWLPVYKNVSMLEHIVNVYHSVGISDLTIVLNAEFCREPWKKKLELFSDAVKIIPNEYPDAGRIHSVRLGIQHVNPEKYVFIHNADNPLVSGKTITRLNEARSEKAVCMPSYLERSGHPVLLKKDLLKRLTDHTAATDTLRSLIARLQKKVVEVEDPGIHININTPGDYLSMLNGLVA